MALQFIPAGRHTDTSQGLIESRAELSVALEALYNKHAETPLDPKSAQGEQVLLAMEELYLTKLLEQDKNPFVLKDEAITLRQKVTDQICLLHNHSDFQVDVTESLSLETIHIRKDLDDNPELQNLTTRVCNEVDGLAVNQHALYTAAGRSATSATQTNDPSIVDFYKKLAQNVKTYGSLC